MQEACIPLSTACQIPGAQAIDRGYLVRQNYLHWRSLSSGSVQVHGSHEIPGVFGMEGLHGPADFRRLGRKAAEATERMVSIAEEGLLKGQELLAILDEISDTLCLVLDTAELCRSVHPDPVSSSFLSLSASTRHFSLFSQSSAFLLSFDVYLRLF